MDKKAIILVGGGGHCKSCIDVIEQENKFQIMGIVDLPDKIGEFVSGYPIIGSDEDIPLLAKKYHYYLITLGQIKSAKLRARMFSQLKLLKVKLPVIISPLAYVSKYAEIKEGTIIMHRAVLNTEAKVGCNCIINTEALIEHEAKVGKNTHVSTRAVINGQVDVGEKCFIGSNAIINNNITIPNETIIGAGSHVYRSIDSPGIYIGNPIRKIEE